jgi:hypothetical protein
MAACNDVDMDLTCDEFETCSATNVGGHHVPSIEAQQAAAVLAASKTGCKTLDAAEFSPAAAASASVKRSPHATTFASLELLVAQLKTMVFQDRTTRCGVMPTYLRDVHHGTILPGWRKQVVSWLLDVTTEFGLSSTTGHAAVLLLDRFLSKRPVRNSELQMLGLTCIILASKLHDSTHLRLVSTPDPLLSFGCYSVVYRRVSRCVSLNLGFRRMQGDVDRWFSSICSAKDVYTVELAVLTTLEYDLHGVTAFDVATRLCSLLGDNTPQFEVVMRLLVDIVPLAVVGTLWTSSNPLLWCLGKPPVRPVFRVRSPWVPCFGSWRCRVRGGVAMCWVHTRAR